MVIIVQPLLTSFTFKQIQVEVVRVRRALIVRFLWMLLISQRGYGGLITSRMNSMREVVERVAELKSNG